MLVQKNPPDVGANVTKLFYPGSVCAACVASFKPQPPSVASDPAAEQAIMQLISKQEADGSWVSLAYISGILDVIGFSVLRMVAARDLASPSQPAETLVATCAVLSVLQAYKSSQAHDQATWNLAAENASLFVRTNNGHALLQGYERLATSRASFGTEWRPPVKLECAREKCIVCEINEGNLQRPYLVSDSNAFPQHVLGSGFYLSTKASLLHFKSRNSNHPGGLRALLVCEVSRHAGFQVM